MQGTFKQNIVGFLLMLLQLSAYSQEWGESSRVVSSDRTGYDRFGRSVAIGSDYAMIGSPFHDRNRAGKDSIESAGAVYFYERQPNGRWKESQKVTAPHRSLRAYFGASVSMFGDLAIVGAYGDYRDSLGDASDSLYNAGSAYLYVRNSTTAKWEFFQKITARTRQKGSSFGTVTSIHGQTIFIGAPYEDKLIGNGKKLANSGAVYVFEPNSSFRWVLKARIESKNVEAFDYFGNSISLSKKTAVIGALFEDENENDVDSIHDTGSAYIFSENSNGEWEQVQKIVASDRSDGAQFGFTVSLDGDDLVIGAPFEDKNEQTKDSLTSAGAVYFFQKETNGVWKEQSKVVPSNRSAHDHFGDAVSIDKGIAVVGAKDYDYFLPFRGDIINGGAFYVFGKQAQGSWKQLQHIVSSKPETNALFGGSIAIRDSLIVAAAEAERLEGKTDAERIYSGASYFFDLYNPERKVLDLETCKELISPSGKYTWDQSGIYRDTLQNALGRDSVVFVINLAVHNVDTSVLVLPHDGILVSLANFSTYQWLDCDQNREPIAGGNSQTFRPKQSGYYAVVVANQYCTDTSTCHRFDFYNPDRDTVSITSCGEFVSPSARYVWNYSGVYRDTLFNRQEEDSIVFVLNLQVERINPNVLFTDELLVALQDSAEYQWLDCDKNYEILAFQTDQWYEPSENGNYAVEIRKNMCTDTSECLSFENLDAATMAREEAPHIYPNPGSGIFVIDAGNAALAGLEVRELSGKVIITQVVRGKNQTTINLTQQPAGLYWLQLHFEGGRQQRLPMVKLN